MNYQPGPGGIAAPDYGRPPHKSRAGLFIALMLILLVAVLGTGVFVATKVVASLKPEGSPPPAPVTSVARPPKVTASVKPKPTTPVKTVPVKPVPITPAPPAPVTAAQLAERFLARLNANDAVGAAALACADTKAFIPIVMGQSLQPPTSLRVGGKPSGAEGTLVYMLVGRTKGAEIIGSLVLDTGERPPCVQVFSAAALR